MKPIKSVDTRMPSTYGTLYKIGGIVALIAALLCRRNFDAEYFLLRTAGIIKVGTRR